MFMLKVGGEIGIAKQLSLFKPNVEGVYTALNFADKYSS